MKADTVPLVLLVNPASTVARHKTFEPNIYPNLGLLTLATSLEVGRGDAATIAKA